MRCTGLPGLATLAFVPQVVRMLRTGSARDFGLPMLLLFSLGLGSARPPTWRRMR
jgi:uncharacterized protein with PQ loop repeat